jgi:hypothetical protein
MSLQRVRDPMQCRARALRNTRVEKRMRGETHARRKERTATVASKHSRERVKNTHNNSVYCGFWFAIWAADHLFLSSRCRLVSIFFCVVAALTATMRSLR